MIINEQLKQSPISTELLVVILGIEVLIHKTKLDTVCLSFKRVQPKKKGDSFYATMAILENMIRDFNLTLCVSEATIAGAEWRVKMYKKAGFEIEIYQSNAYVFMTKGKKW